MPTSELNPQPLPPRRDPDLSPQPLPPERAIRLEDFTENITTAVLRAIESHQKAQPNTLFQSARIIVGYIIEPPLQAGLRGGGQEGIG